MEDLKLKFVLIRDNKGFSRLNVIVDCPPGGCYKECVDCSEVLETLKKCVKEEEVEKRK